jgi:DNA invertase Pin-like site-specific DNA recombinase
MDSGRVETKNVGNLVFAALIRVSTESQAKKGESLFTQRKQLESAISLLGGKLYKRYEGHEHATPAQERKILDELILDGINKKFNAIMVTDMSRWSRDNRKNKEYLEILKINDIKFFVNTREYDLFNYEQYFMIGMGVEIAEYFARGQSYKSIINRIERAKKGFPTCGKLPYGRDFDEKSGVWKVNAEEKAIVEEAALLYLHKSVSFKELGKNYGMNPSNLCKILTKRCSDKWVQRFKSKGLGIDETVTIDVPRLLPEAIIDSIKQRCLARKTWEHGSQKYQYLLSRLIFDAETGYALTGTPNGRGVRYYKPYRGNPNSYLLNADLIERALTDVLFEALGSNKAMSHAVFAAVPDNHEVEELKKRRDVYKKKLASIEQKLKNARKAMLEFQGSDMDSFLKQIKEDVGELQKNKLEIVHDIQTIDARLVNIPTRREIVDKRNCMQQLIERITENYFNTGYAFRDLNFQEKQNVMRLIFGGKDDNGKRFGIYIRRTGDQPKRYEFYAYGKLGVIEGRIEDQFIDAMAANEIYTNTHEQIVKQVSDLIKDCSYKERVLGKQDSCTFCHQSS